MAQDLLTPFPGWTDLAPITKPFDTKTELAGLRAVLMSMSIAAPEGVVAERKRQADQPREGEQGRDARVRRETVRFYSAVLVARGDARKPLNPPKAEAPGVVAEALLEVISHFLMSVPDEAIIEANRSAYRDLQSLADDPSPEAEAARSMLEIYMRYLGGFMDATGVTDRYMASLPTGSAH
jgi:hypothetical protein